MDLTDYESFILYANNYDNTSCQTIDPSFNNHFNSNLKIASKYHQKEPLIHEPSIPENTTFQTSVLVVGVVNAIVGHPLDTIKTRL